MLSFVWTCAPLADSPMIVLSRYPRRYRDAVIIDQSESERIVQSWPRLELRNQGPYHPTKYTYDTTAEGARATGTWEALRKVE